MSDGTIINANVFDVLPLLDDESVQCCVTSPPYWGLRDYGTGVWEDGPPECDHSRRTSTKIGAVTTMSNPTNNNHECEGWLGGVCGKCGAHRVDDQLGLEKTPEEYVYKLVKVFREVRRILKKDGTLWLNLGDSYVRAGGTDKSASATALVGSTRNSIIQRGNRTQNIPSNYKTKDLVGIPWMVAFALRADGWYLRQDVIWAKPNPMPESVRDRCTRSHEYLFLLSKSKKYYFDLDALKEPSVTKQSSGGQKGRGGKTAFRGAGAMRFQENGRANRNGRQMKEIGAGGFRQRRDVWTISTKPYKGAHFATFPIDLVQPCVLAGSRPTDIVLDPFGGSGTVAQVAKQYGRDYLLIELNSDYCALAEQRIDKQKPAPEWTTPVIDWSGLEISV